MLLLQVPTIEDSTSANSILAWGLGLSVLALGGMTTKHFLALDNYAKRTQKLNDKHAEELAKVHRAYTTSTAELNREMIRIQGDILEKSHGWGNILQKAMEQMDRFPPEMKQLMKEMHEHILSEVRRLAEGVRG